MFSFVKNSWFSSLQCYICPYISVYSNSAWITSNRIISGTCLYSKKWTCLNRCPCLQKSVVKISCGELIHSTSNIRLVSNDYHFILSWKFVQYVSKRFVKPLTICLPRLKEVNRNHANSCLFGISHSNQMCEICILLQCLLIVCYILPPFLVNYVGKCHDWW